MSYCERCTGLIAFIDRELGGNPNSQCDLDIYVSIGCSLCALMFDQLSLYELDYLM
jgi:hypothetical protein